MIDKNPGILVVDCEDLVRSMCASVFRSHGITVLLANSRDEATRVYQAHQDEIDLVLLDAMISGQGGLLTLGSLLAIDPGVRVCCLNGGSSKYSREDLLNSGAIEVLSRPLSDDDVQSVLDLLGPDSPSE